MRSVLGWPVRCKNLLLEFVTTTQPVAASERRCQYLKAKYFKDKSNRE